MSIAVYVRVCARACRRLRVSVMQWSCLQINQSRYPTDRLISSDKTATPRNFKLRLNLYHRVGAHEGGIFGNYTPCKIIIITITITLLRYAAGRRPLPLTCNRSCHALLECTVYPEVPYLIPPSCYWPSPSSIPISWYTFCYPNCPSYPKFRYPNFGRTVRSAGPSSK